MGGNFCATVGSRNFPNIDHALYRSNISNCEILIKFHDFFSINTQDMALSIGVSFLCIELRY